MYYLNEFSRAQMWFSGNPMSTFLWGNIKKYITANALGENLKVIKCSTEIKFKLQWDTITEAMNELAKCLKSENTKGW